MFEDWLELARTEPRILGVVLTGSRGRKAYVRSDSDWDLRIVVRDGEEAFARSLDTGHGPDVEVSASTLAAFRESPEWDRYSYAHADVPVDKLGGEIQEIVAARGTLATVEARAIARDGLRAYTNSLYRSLRDDEAGLGLAARLDATESLSPLLVALFAFERRLRPFNKYLVWELETHPLREWKAAELRELVANVLSGQAEPQRAAFRRVEAQVRAHGHGDLLDEWGRDLALLRGEA